MAVREGDPAPGFRLPEAPGEYVDVGALIGRERVVLLFFPLAFSPTCTTELCTFRDRWEDFHGLGARLFGLSVDSPFVTDLFRRQQELPFPVLSDFNREAARLYDVLYDDLFGLKGVGKRAVFVIGTDGTVVYRWVCEDPGVEPDYEAVRRAVSST
jgi:peroxiredoxin